MSGHGTRGPGGSQNPPAWNRRGGARVPNRILSTLALSTALLAASCVREPPEDPRGPRAGTSSPSVEAALLAAEDARSAAAVHPLLDDPRPGVRARALVALGRIRDPAAAAPLIGSLSDPDAGVREAAAFALGLLGDEAAAAPLAAALADPSPPVRAQAAGALTRLPPAPGRAASLRPLLERSRGAAAVEALYGLWRLQDASVLDAVLARTAAPEDELRRAAAYCLMRMASATAVGGTPVPGGTDLGAAGRRRAADALGRLASDADGRIRELAARGLGGPEMPGAVGRLRRMLGDPSWRVRVNVLRSLGNTGGFDPADLRPLLEDENPNVRLAALGALASLPDGGPLTDRIGRELEDGPAALRAAAAAARAAWEGTGALPMLRRLAGDPDPRMRAAAASIVGDLPGHEAEALLRSLLRDRSAAVVAAALTSLAGRDGADRRALGLQGLSARDFTVRATAIGLLPADDPAVAEVLAGAWERALADPQNDVRIAVARSLGKMPAREPATRLLARMLDEDPDWRVRVEAAVMLRARGIPAAAPALESGRGLSYYEQVLRDGLRPHAAVLETERGNIELELFSADAPLTVRNFEDLARSGYFDGLTLHRVVPNFVVQGGDPRGDGWGGPGHQIRCEINRRRYRRGTVGMALDGYDTGGSQIFITHTPQPHLDGAYTVFGRVRRGMEVVDRLVQGDRIEAVRTLEAVP